MCLALVEGVPIAVLAIAATGRIATVGTAFLDRTIDVLQNHFEGWIEVLQYRLYIK
jgi:hypothetical protein